MRRALLVLALFVATPATAQSPRSFDFRGERLGDPVPAQAAKLCGSLVVDSLFICMRLDSIGAVVVSIVREFYHDRLLRWTAVFDSRDVAAMLAAARDKFAAPSVRETAELQTASGGRLVGDVVKWVLGADTLVVRQFDESATRGTMLIVNQSLFREWQRFNEKKNGM